MNIHDNAMLSLRMKQKYQSQDNGPTYLKYFIDLDKNSFKDIAIEYLASITHPLFLDIESSCNLNKISQFHIRNEEEYFVKSGAYSSHKKLLEAYAMAEDDDIRFHLYDNLYSKQANLNNCQALKDLYYLLNIGTEEFYQLYIKDGLTINEIYSTKKSDLLDLQQHYQDYLLGSFSEQDNVELLPDMTSEIDNALNALFSLNSNIIFTKSSDLSSSNIAIYIGGGADDFIIYENHTNIIRTYLGVNLEYLNSGSPSDRIDLMHAFAHIFLDHPCENGLHICNKEQIQQDNPMLGHLSVMSGIMTPTIDEAFTDTARKYKQEMKAYNVQSLLPLDLAAIRYDYGMPKSINMTYTLDNTSSLNEIFAMPLVNNSLVTFSMIGDISIDTTNVNEYEIDLNYDTLSNITNNDINFHFILSYDTEIAKIIINNSGSITLNNNFKTDIELLPGCYDIILNEDQNTSKYFCSESYYNEEIHISNFDPSLHDLYYSQN